MTEGRRAALAKYAASEKGRASNARYERTEKARIRKRRYESKSRRAQTQNAHRLFVGNRYVGRAATVTMAEAINTHIKGRLHGFVERQQGRAEVEALSAHGISVEAGA